MIGGREGSLVGGVAWGQDFDPGSFWASNPQNVVHCVEKAHLVPDSTPHPRPHTANMAQQPPDVEEDDCLSEYHHLFCPDLLQ